MSSKKSELANLSPEARRQAKALESLEGRTRADAQDCIDEAKILEKRGKKYCYNVGVRLSRVLSEIQQGTTRPPVAEAFCTAIGLDVDTGRRAARIVEWRSEAEVMSSPLSWGHLELLMQIGDEMTRVKWEEKAVKHTLSIHRLREELKKAGARKKGGPAARPRAIQWDGVLSNVNAHRTELSARFEAFGAQVVDPLMAFPPDAKVVATVRKTREGLEELVRETQAKIDELRRIERDQEDKARKAVLENQEVLQAAHAGGKKGKDADPHPAGEANGTLKNRIVDAPRRQRPAAASA